MQLSSEQTPHPQLYRPQHRRERGPTEELGTPPAPIPHPAAPPVLPPHSAPLGAEHTQGCPSPSQPHGDSNVPAAPAPPPTLAWRYPEGSADPTGHSGPHVLPGPGWTPTPTSPLIPTWTRMGPHGRAITPPGHTSQTHPCPHPTWSKTHPGLPQPHGDSDVTAHPPTPPSADPPPPARSPRAAAPSGRYAHPVGMDGRFRGAPESRGVFGGPAAAPCAFAPPRRAALRAAHTGGTEK